MAKLMQTERPPLGAKPEWLHREHRCDELAKAISDRIRSGEVDTIAQTWCKELRGHIDWLINHRDTKKN